jgi:hypothetical protein
MRSPDGTHETMDRRRFLVALGTVVCGGLLVIVIAGLSAGCRDSSTASAPPPPPVVKVEPVTQKDVPIYGEWVGTTVGTRKEH